MIMRPAPISCEVIRQKSRLHNPLFLIFTYQINKPGIRERFHVFKRKGSTSGSYPKVRMSSDIILAAFVMSFGTVGFEWANITLMMMGIP